MTERKLGKRQKLILLQLLHEKKVGLSVNEINRGSGGRCYSNFSKKWTRVGWAQVLRTLEALERMGFVVDLSKPYAKRVEREGGVWRRIPYKWQITAKGIERLEEESREVHSWGKI